MPIRMTVPLVDDQGGAAEIAVEDVAGARPSPASRGLAAAALTRPLLCL